MDYQIISKHTVNLLNIGDYEIISEFNKRKKETPSEIKSHLLPEPFIGRPETAKVIFLALNPGYAIGHSPDHDTSDEKWHRDSKYRKLIIDNLAQIEVDYPYYYFNEDPYFANTPGHQWCKTRFKELINESKQKDISVKKLSQRIACIQYHGYHSSKYSSFGKKLPSQAQTLDFVKSAMDNETLIVIMRSQKIWFGAIDGLKDYPNKIILKNFRNPTISRGNMQYGEFDRILDKIVK